MYSKLLSLRPPPKKIKKDQNLKLDPNITPLFLLSCCIIFAWLIRILIHRVYVKRSGNHKKCDDYS